MNEKLKERFEIFASMEDYDLTKQIDNTKSYEDDYTETAWVGYQTAWQACEAQYEIAGYVREGSHDIREHLSSHRITTRKVEASDIEVFSIKSNS